LLIIKEHIEMRKLIFGLAKNDLIKTYRGSALGWIWSLIKPTILIFVFWFAISIGLRGGGPVNEYPFFLWLIAGMVPWFYMSEMISAGTFAIRKYKYLVTKMKFNVSIIPTFFSLSSLFVHTCMMVIVILIFVFKGFTPDIYYLQLPFYMLFMFIFFTTWSLFSAPLAAISNDYGNLVKSLVTAIFWLSGVLWDVNSLQIGWLKILLKFNPVTYFASGYRNVFIYKKWFWEDISSFLIMAGITLVLGIIATRNYKKLRTDLPDVL
jgi:teichoic acid transport system permease protein